MENSKYLSEETFQKNKKKVIRASIIILILGFLIGGGLIVTGIIKSSSVGTSGTTGRSEVVIQAEIDKLSEEVSTLQSQMTQELMKNGSSEKFLELQSEVNAKTKKIADLESEVWENDGVFSSTKNEIEKSKYIPFYMFGGFIIVVSCMIAGSIYMFAKRREIAAFTTQQVMPVAQEGIEKISPTIGNAAGTIAKSIKDSLKDEEENK